MKTAAILLVALGLVAVGLAAAPAATAFTCTPTPREQVCVDVNGVHSCVELQGEIVITPCIP